MPLAIVLAILLLDQAIKIWIKTHMQLGDEIHVAGDWFIIHFTENNGMAFGYELGGRWGKLLLTSFRILAVGVIAWYINQLIVKNAHKGLIACLALVFAGAIGNIIDSVFYGVFFNYAPLFYGRVVDMFYFPVVNSYYPDWVPFFGGDELVFFRPVFNIADASISTGIFAIIIFQNRLFPKEIRPLENPTEEAIIENMVDEANQNRISDTEEEDQKPSV